ncbi:MAG TPA: maleylpyruvate isomerase family mycothiol-dependent enzyme [Actinomycetota bacterium]|nr:maleylpyruvate isomerase family mycothiol-dependent enzyme [Actinomycetota bacterium]
MPLELENAAAALDAEYRAVDAIASGLSEEELLDPSGCRGWSRADLLFHMLLDAQRALVTLHSPAPGPPDTDYVRYWRGFSSSDDGARAHARFVRVASAAHASPATIVARWLETSRAARHAASLAGEGAVATQGHVLTTPDFLATLVVEATVHHLDLSAGLDREPPAPAAVALTTLTIDGLLRSRRPPHWDDVTYLRKATGRAPLDDDDVAALGEAAASLPVFS